MKILAGDFDPSSAFFFMGYFSFRWIGGPHGSLRN